MRIGSLLAVGILALAAGPVHAEERETKKYVALSAFPICAGTDPTIGGACFTPPLAARGERAHIATVDDTARHAFGLYQIICEREPGYPEDCEGYDGPVQGDYCDGSDITIPKNAAMVQVFVDSTGCYDIDDLATTGTITMTWNAS